MLLLVVCVYYNVVVNVVNCCVVVYDVAIVDVDNAACYVWFAVHVAVYDLLVLLTSVLVLVSVVVVGIAVFADVGIAHAAVNHVVLGSRVICYLIAVGVATCFVVVDGVVYVDMCSVACCVIM